MHPSHLLGLSLMIALSACSSQHEDSTDSTTPASTTAPAVTAPPFTPTTSITSAPVDAQAPAASAGAVSDPNPPHGQPGHRCEIPVGASLSSAAPAAAATQTISSPVMSNSSPTQAATPAGLNPPHGQPGHDCAVPVGSPLPAK